MYGYNMKDQFSRFKSGKIRLTNSASYEISINLNIDDFKAFLIPNQ